ncbi:MAG: bifunctional adenosylcobinamide kinase/adenosylcobinamide-phosphate guanylyltransferase [Planctomycetia bacterium]|nr:bifunctional adenosylcobinamide kinase/adenosylcobinamide-phosphate guanylyltransferase [Planctomycetia bacterium]
MLLILGGVRSGKSRLAERLATARPPVTYLATAQAGDEEMSRRIAVHRGRRPLDWTTREEPWDIAGAVGGCQRQGTLLLECLSLWLTNRLVGLSGRTGESDEAIRAAVGELLTAVHGAAGRIVVVSSEVGCGIVPMNALSRRFADLIGEANQRLAEAAAEVYWCLAGIPVRIKPGADGNTQTAD